VFAQPGARVDSLMTPKVVEVKPNVDQEQVAKIFDHYSLVELGVVDEEGKLIGRITADDVHEVLVEEAEEDMLKMAGARADTDVIYSDKVFRVAWLRLPWLASNFVSGFIAALILNSADVVFGRMVVLLTFVPVITGMSGNVGSQSAMIMIRGMAAGNVSDDGILRYIARDVTIGSLMAIVCGVVVTSAVALWMQSIPLGICVGSALTISMVTASVLGSSEPGLLKRFGVDPAIAAGPLITSINDISGVIIYTLVAMVFMRYFV
jgi:magnesium transporter